MGRSLCESAELMNAEMGDTRCGISMLLTRSLLYFLNTQDFFLDWICYSKQLNMNVLLVLAINLHSLRAAWNTESMWLKNWLCKQGICLRGWRKIGKIQLAKACHTLVYFKTVRKFQHLQFSFLYRYTKREASSFKNHHEMSSPPHFSPILITSSLWN